MFPVSSDFGRLYCLSSSNNDDNFIIPMRYDSKENIFYFVLVLFGKANQTAMNYVCSVVIGRNGRGKHLLTDIVT